MGHVCLFVPEHVRGGSAGHSHSVPGREWASSRPGQATEGWLLGALQGCLRTHSKCRVAARAALQVAFGVGARDPEHDAPQPSQNKPRKSDWRHFSTLVLSTLQGWGFSGPPGKLVLVKNRSLLRNPPLPQALSHHFLPSTLKMQQGL